MGVRSFDSWDEIYEKMQRDQQEADSQVKPWQSALKKGDYFHKVHATGISIYGEILRVYKNKEMKNYRFVRAYSIACPKGELGDNHVSTIEGLLSREEFEEMKMRGWG